MIPRSFSSAKTRASLYASIFLLILPIIGPAKIKDKKTKMRTIKLVINALFFSTDIMQMPVIQNNVIIAFFLYLW